MPLSISEFELHFYTPGAISGWRKFCVEAGILPASSAKNGEDFAKSFVLVKKNGKKWEAVFGQVHTVGQGRKEKGLAMHWHLDWQADAPPPPPQVLEMSKRIGGLDGLLSHFAEKWPKRAARKCKGSYLCRFRTRVVDIECLPWPTPQSFSLDSREIAFQPGAIEWELAPPIGSISELKIARSGKIATLLASGDWTGEITGEAFVEARGRAKADLESVLEQCRA